MSETGEDCHFFMTTGCSKGAECSFRHSSAAKETTTVCRHWLSNSCSKLGCTFRHPTRQAAAAAPAAMAMGMGGMGMGMGLGGAPPPNMCVFFMKGKCNKGANCPFLHHFMDPFQMQMQMFQQQQMQQLAQQQHQQQGGYFEETQTRPQKRNERGERGQKTGGSGGGRVVRGEAEEDKKKQPREKRPLSEAEKEALLAKPLQAGSVSKKFNDKPTAATPAPLVVIAKSEPPVSKRAKPDRASLASGASAVRRGGRDCGWRRREERKDGSYGRIRASRRGQRGASAIRKRLSALPVSLVRCGAVRRRKRTENEDKQIITAMYICLSFLLARLHALLACRDNLLAEGKQRSLVGIEFHIKAF